MEQFEQLDRYLSQTKGTRYPIQKPSLIKTGDPIRNRYFRMLCLVLRSGGDIIEEQRLFLQRLITGSEAAMDWQEYMRLSGEIDTKQLEDFLLETRDHALCYDFVLDAMVLVNLGPRDEKQAEFLAALCEGLRLSPVEAETLAHICAAILRQDPASAIRYEMNLPERGVRLEGLQSYFMEQQQFMRMESDEDLLCADFSTTPNNLDDWIQEYEYYLDDGWYE